MVYVRTAEVIGAGCGEVFPTVPGNLERTRDSNPRHPAREGWCHCAARLKNRLDAKAREALHTTFPPVDEFLADGERLVTQEAFIAWRSLVASPCHRARRPPTAARALDVIGSTWFMKAE
jgi:hypothetical protein